MILEHAEFHIHPGKQAEFEAAVKLGVETIISKTPGFIAYQLQHSVEQPETYFLFIRWETLEAHVVGFRESPAFPAWRAVVGPFFASAPNVMHLREAHSTF
ncbi:putative antibiotic biosynthesis monooxygenase [Paratrimastix pyriformis]|uniref:Antibiotic biosynthesis monooxygenase n=1 Tax=Paratrimastix pyriformis TaxID=342808 RepID=A0ABQ8UKS2_9EUKA|nr:putative antibiotic biosynthesis monooxygenase [Paratrimastix pyriformis]